MSLLRLLPLSCLVPLLAQADSIVVFNEIMYHPFTNEAALEWVELHNQMAVDVDLSGWALTGGSSYQFAEGTVISGGGYVVVSVSPADLRAATGLTNVFGPFTGRLSNAGETLELYNRNHRLMDAITYGVDGDWPVGPDGSGVSLAKRDEDAASAAPESWTVSAWTGGTPGRRNFPLQPFEVTNTIPQTINGTWKFNASGSDLGTAWRSLAFDDSGWSSGPGLFQAGTVTPPLGNPEPIASVFSSGLDASGKPVSPGSPDPHYLLTQSAQSTPPPPAIAATVILNHPAWLANDSLSSWIGPVNPGASGVNPGNYNFRTRFTLDGYNLPSAQLGLGAAVDNRLTDVLLNGNSLGFSFAGFGGLSSMFTVTNALLPSTNTLDFLTANDGTGANPAGFRVRLVGTARRSFASKTTLLAAPTTSYFRTRFLLNTAPSLALLKLDAVVADGAVFYLNGTEVLRLNLPTGPISAATSALSNVPTPAYLGPLVLPNSAMVAGTNVLAVEIHQAAGTNKDLLFGAGLALTATNILEPPPFTLALNEISSATNAEFWGELINYGSTDLELGGCVLVRLGATTNREFVFPSYVLTPGALVQVSRAALGFAADPGDRLFLYGPWRTNLLDAVVATAASRGRWPDGTGHWWYPTTLTPGASNAFTFRKEIVINEIMYSPPGLPPLPATYATNVFVSITNGWKYHGLGQDLGTAWRTPGFDDSAWPSNRAMFYNTTASLPAAKSTQLPLTNATGARIVTWYFRTPFVYTGSTNGVQIMLRPIVDDGAVYYLNGAELFRQNMPAGEIRYTNLANASVATPAYSGPFSVVPTTLVLGVNVLAVEVHQFTINPIAADMAFGLEISTAGQATPAQPYRDVPEAWLELFNRSSNAVDLTGWMLGGDLAYGFTPGTLLAPGGYLVVAKDLSYMQTNYPGLTVVGPFGNKLSRSSGHLLLLDPAGNPANEVQYFNGSPWPEYAAGGGSSLELRDPWADNSKAQAWAASLEGGRSTWVGFTNRGLSSNVLGPTTYNEFVMGLVEAGECLIDDLSVVESPSGTPISMLQNGTFETGLTAWRTLGDHAWCRVEQDPAKQANHVLHLISTGPTDHLHNHLETTFAAGRSVTDGREYQISFRAKWLAGNNHLNTRLYFNRLAKTFTLPMPAQHGTPGARNSTVATNMGPTFESLQHSPIVPQAGDPVTVTATASDPQGVATMTLWWSTNAGSWQTLPMSPNLGAAAPGYASYAAALPGLPAGTLVQFFARATDTLGAVSYFPPGGTNSRALYKVDEGKALMTQLHRFRLLMLPAEADFLHAPTNVMSNDRLGLTVVYDERTAIYDAGVHLQSSERGRNDTSRVGFTVSLPADHPLRGVQKNFTLDRSGGYSGLGGRHDEILLWHAANHAGGGLLGYETDLSQVFAPRTSEDSTGMLRMADFNGSYLDGQFPNGGNGNLYKLELIYYPLTTVTGDPQSPKLPNPDEVINVELQDWGDNPDNYRWVFMQENNGDQDDYSQVMAMSKAFSLTGASLEAQTSQQLDTDEWLRTLAFKDLTGDVDTFTHGLNHNVKIYFRSDTGQSLLLLWDEDYSFVQGVTAGFPGNGSANTYNFVMLPNNYRRYCNHLLDLTTTTMNAPHLGPWATRYAGLLGQDWSGVVSYIQQRASYIQSALPATPAFSISNNNGNNFGTSNSPVLLTGLAPLALKDITINGSVYPITWTSPSTWTIKVPLPAFTNRLVLQGLDNRGNPLANVADSITVTNLGQLAVQTVVINEWMAENSGPGGFLDPLSGSYSDWFELYNPNNIATNVSGFFLSDKLSNPTLWQIPPGTVLPPHGFRHVWADNQTNLNALSTNGDLHVNFQLSKKGETVALFAPGGTLLHAVTFGAQFPNVSQGLYPDGNTNAYYFMTNWTPRASNRLDPLQPPVLLGTMLGGSNNLTFMGVPSLPERAYLVQFKEDFANPVWTSLATNRPVNGVLSITDTTTNSHQRFYRLQLLQ